MRKLAEEYPSDGVWKNEFLFGERSTAELQREVRGRISETLQYSQEEEIDPPALWMAQVRSRLVERLCPADSNLLRVTTHPWIGIHGMLVLSLSSGVPRTAVTFRLTKNPKSYFLKNPDDVDLYIGPDEILPNPKFYRDAVQPFPLAENQARGKQRASDENLRNAIAERLEGIFHRKQEVRRDPNPATRQWIENRQPGRH